MMSSTPPNHTQHYQRIVLTFNLGGGDSQVNAMKHTIHYAGLFTENFNSHVTCLCIRDRDLLDYAGLPFAREFSLHSTLARSLNADDVRNDMDRRASSIRHSLASLIANQQRPDSFLTVEGRLDEKIIETAQENDLIVMAVPPPVQRNFGTTYQKIQNIIAKRPCDLLLATETYHPRAGAIILIVDRHIPSERALRLAFHSAIQHQAPVEIFISDDADLLKSVKQNCNAVLATPSLSSQAAPDCSFHPLNQWLSHPWQRHPCSFTILEFDGPLPSLNLIECVLNIFCSPMLLLRKKQA